jgi:hypothetical protein
LRSTCTPTKKSDASQRQWRARARCLRLLLLLPPPLQLLQLLVAARARAMMRAAAHRPRCLARCRAAHAATRSLPACPPFSRRRVDVLDGSGYFDIKDAADAWIRIAMSKGDMIVLPAGMYHRFTLDEKNFIQAMRLFVGEPVWTAYNRSADGTDAMPARGAYVKSISAA